MTEHWVLFGNQMHEGRDQIDVRLFITPFDLLSGKYEDERGVTQFNTKILAWRMIPEGLSEEEVMEFEKSVYPELKAEVLAQAASIGVDPDTLHFAYDEGFGKLDPAMPHKNVLRMFKMLDGSVEKLKKGEYDTGYYPYGKLYKYVLEQKS